MSESVVTRLGAWFTRARRFFAHDVWQQNLEQLPHWQAFRYRTARIAYCTTRGLLFEDQLHVRAAALTYFTVLSLVPLLAFAFALLKGFGAYESLVEEQLRPWMMQFLAGNQALSQALDKVLEFVDKTNVASLGALGLLLLLYSATRLLRNIESALNEIWGARSGRDLLEQLRDYTAIIVVTPLSLLAAFALTTLGQALDVLRAAGNTLGVSAIVEGAIALIGPLAVLFLGLCFLYIVMPHAHVRIRSAAVGAFVGAIVWYLVLIAHVRLQVGVASYNALYSGFAAFPIFLAWQHISWLVVLVGAQIASLHQHHRSIARRTRLVEADQAFRETTCLAAVLRIARAFSQGNALPSREELSLELDVPDELVADLLDRLVVAGMLVETSAPKRAYALAKPPERIRVKEVLDTLRRSPKFQADLRTAPLDPVAVRIWGELDRGQGELPANCTLADALLGGASNGDGARSRRASEEAARRSETPLSEGGAV